MSNPIPTIELFISDILQEYCPDAREETEQGAGQLSAWFSDWLKIWQNDWMLPWKNDWLKVWQSDWMLPWKNDWKLDWITVWKNDWMLPWKNDWLKVWQIDWKLPWQNDWKTIWNLDWKNFGLLKGEVGRGQDAVQCVAPQGSPLPSLVTRTEEFGGLVYDAQSSRVFKVNEPGLMAVEHLAARKGVQETALLLGASEGDILNLLHFMEQNGTTVGWGMIDA